MHLFLVFLASADVAAGPFVSAILAAVVNLVIVSFGSCSECWGMVGNFIHL